MFKKFRSAGFLKASIAVVIIAALAACGGGEDGASPKVAANAQMKMQAANQQSCPSGQSSPAFDTVLATPVFSMNTYLSDQTFNTIPPNPAGQRTVVVRDVWSFVNNTLTVSQDYLPSASSTNWTSAPTGVFDQDRAKYLMKADGTWTDLLTAAQLHPSLQGSVICGNFIATDPNTNIEWTYMYAPYPNPINLSNAPLSAGLGTFSTSVFGSRMTGSFPSGVTGYAPYAYSASSDSFYIPTWDTQSDNPSDPSKYYLDGTTPVWNSIGGPNATYTSIQQVFGLQIPTQPGPNGPSAWITLNADGTGQVLQQNGTGAPTVNTNITITWTPYALNPNVLVMNVNRNSIQPPFDVRLTQVLNTANGALAVALRNGRLQLALKTQAVTTAQRVVPGDQLPQGSFDLITPSFTAAVRSYGFQ
ncbi:hypothetical protein [Burkholderia phage FLC9]|nr:hypothetical protein [Burkholderia phage FLC9]